MKFACLFVCLFFDGFAYFTFLHFAVVMCDITLVWNSFTRYTVGVDLFSTTHIAVAFASPDLYFLILNWKQQQFHSGKFHSYSDMLEMNPPLPSHRILLNVSVKDKHALFSNFKTMYVRLQMGLALPPQAGLVRWCEVVGATYQEKHSDKNLSWKHERPFDSRM